MGVFSVTNGDFIERYINYVGRSEAPTTFHRWSALGGVGAYLGKSVWFEHGGFRVYPNLYIQLFGVPGSRKSTSIKKFVSLLKAAGYTDFAAEKTSKEKFIEWLSAKGSAAAEDDMDLWSTIDGTQDSTDALIAADEFTDFFSTNILDFLSFLGVMWDHEGHYEHSTRAGGSVIINNPCISILSGNTPIMLAKTIPPEAIGQGFFSRTIVVYGEETGIKIAFPPAPSDSERDRIVSELMSLRTVTSGAIQMSRDALDICEQIYLTWKRIKDPRFDGYGNRRFNQLLKLCIIHAIAAHSEEIKKVHVIRANTVLTRAEQEMVKALGEFGEARNAAVTNKILKILNAASEPVTINQLWAQVHTDLDRLNALSEILTGLVHAKKAQVVGGNFLPIREVKELDLNATKFVNWNYLTKQERDVIL